MRRTSRIAVRDFVTRHRTKLEVGLALLVAGLAIGALSHLLGAIRWADVKAATAAIGPVRIGAAVILTGASYLLLTLYDVLGLQAIGRPLPYRTAALASFTSYTLSHNLGLALLTGGSARLRVYSEAGLTPAEIARVILIAGLTFWMGVIVTGGAAMIVTGAAGTGLPVAPGLARVAGFAVVAGAFGLLAWCGRDGRTLHIAGWSLPLPPARSGLVQIAVAAADLAVTSAALFLLLPGIAPTLFPVLFLAYVCAIVVALVTHVPGGLGVFETVMLAMLPSLGRPELVAGLLVFRAVYYLLPLLVAIIVLAAAERRRWAPAARVAGRGLRAISFGIVPRVMAALTFAGGLVLLLSGALPGLPYRLSELRHIVPLPFAETSHIAASLVGTGLLMIAPGLYRRQEAACLAARALLLAGAGFSLLKGLDYEEASLMASLAAVLHVTRGAFYRQSLLVRRPLSLEWLVCVALAFGLTIALGLVAYRDVPYHDQLWWQFAWHGNAPRFLRATLFAGLLLAGAAVWRLFLPAGRGVMAEGSATEAEAIVLGRATRTEACLALTGDKRFLVSEAGDAVLMYQVQDASWIAMGDPVGNPAAYPELMWRLRELADRAQGRVLFYQITPATLPVAIDMGLELVKYGEEARIDLAAFTLDGPAARPLRYADCRAEREGAVFEVVERARVPLIMGELRAVSDVWLAAKRGPEKCFSVGRFDPVYMARFDCAVVRCEGRIVAFANIWRAEAGGELSVDLMRHADEVPYGTMDFLMVRTMLWGKAQGFRWFSLGMAPLAGIERRRLSPNWARLGSLLYRHGEAFYGFEGLRTYKQKFAPCWEPRYIAAPRGLGLVRALVDLKRLVGGSRRSAARRAAARPAARSVPGAARVHQPRIAALPPCRCRRPPSSASPKVNQAATRRQAALLQISTHRGHRARRAGLDTPEGSVAKPIFADPTQRRSRWAKRTAAVLAAIVALAAAAFATTIMAVPPAPGLVLPVMHASPAPWRAAREGSHDAAWLHRFGRLRAPTAPATRPLSVGFYLAGDDASLASLTRNLAELDWVVPTSARIDTGRAGLVETPDPKLDRLLAGAASPPKRLPMIQNLDADGGWDGAGTLAMLRDPARARRLAQGIAGLVARQHAAGVVLDLEDLPAGFAPDYLRFLATLRPLLPQGSELAVTAPAGDADWPLAAFAKAADHVVFMAYDEHWMGSRPGPIASQGWFTREVAAARAAVGPAKLIVALGNYAYDWHGTTTDALTVGEAWLAAHDSSADVGFDPASGTPGFAYRDTDGLHQIDMLDAATAWNQLVALRAMGLAQVALWRLGSEDPGFWNALAAARAGTRPDLTRLTELLSSDVEGSGELLRIAAVPTEGTRSVTFAPTGMIAAETYNRLPTPYVVERAGAQDPKTLALTFDDGPDGTLTPQILDILKAARVPATFFVVGENALAHPGILNRIVAQGSELGSHTYTHPNLAEESPQEERLELNATQRLVEAYTGRRMTLFRAPYFGDAEPTTLDELEPARLAQEAGYTVVGLHVDPGDWQRPGAAAIVQRTLDQIHAATAAQSGNVILLHDGGGDRSQTVAALPVIIARLKAEGYRFVTASQLVGVGPAQAMPRIGGSDLAAVRIDVGVFMVLAGLLVLIGWIFAFAITLGIARAVVLASLAWSQSRKVRPAPPVFTPTVSVIIPAYNEERVIAASVARVLASDYPDLEVIVADDGSSDATSACVRAAFGNDPRVTLLTLVNGGKAAALNRALRHATGEVIIALDADTQFEALTIRRLARWFADPAIGAVAGDARVGNRVNLVTRWQAIEYITAQNLERRALAGFGAMMVVPGAVGAWRRAALDAVGGYPENTLAEDQDLTIAIQRRGWRVTYDAQAAAWTEAPESFKALAKQRYRWAFGTLQCLWKHRAILRERRPRGLAFIGMPQAWAFQILFAAISPIIDLALVISVVGTIARVMQHGWAQTSGDVTTIGLFWAAFSAIDVACGWVAYRLDGRGVRYPFGLLLAQRLVYRQIMYWVVLKAIGSAIAGWSVGWGKLERSGRVDSAAGLEQDPAMFHVKHADRAGLEGVWQGSGGGQARVRHPARRRKGRAQSSSQ